MKWIIKCPAPGGYSQRNWGDLHFARSLARQLEKLGCEVVVQNQPDWTEGEDDADAVLLIRGKYAYEPRNPDAINIMWVLSHPENVTHEEFENFDINCIASTKYARQLQAHYGREKVMPLLQCTDTGEYPETELLPASARREVIFVGNSRNVERWYVLEHVREGLPLKIWGTGWEPWPEVKQRVAGKHVENQRIGKLYGSARATLNDHWPDMASYGFINNRVFDALACGLPIISDYLPELDEMFGDAIHYYRKDEPIRTAFSDFDRNYARQFDKVQSLAASVARKHSFAARADELLSSVYRHRQQRFGGSIAMVFHRLRRRWS
jgi:hypothetical protein